MMMVVFGAGASYDSIYPEDLPIQPTRAAGRRSYEANTAATLEVPMSAYKHVLDGMTKQAADALNQALGS